MGTVGVVLLVALAAVGMYVLVSRSRRKADADELRRNEEMRAAMDRGWKDRAK